MNREPVRKFNIADWMLLVVATAVGIASYRALPGTGMLRYFVSRAWGQDLGSRLAAGVLMIWPWAAGLTIAVFWMRLRKPRPTRRRMFRQPGMIACTSALLALCFCGMTVPACRAMMADWEYFRLIAYLFCLCPAFGGIAVASSWTIALLSGAWSRDSGWIDRLGTSLGIVWIAIAPFSLWFGIHMS